MTLQIEDLAISIGGRSVVDGVSLSVGAGETLGLVGESGSGKTQTALSILALNAGTVTRGRFLFRGDLVGDRRKLRGRAAGMIFQEPLTALNPVYRIGDQIAEAMDGADVRAALSEVGIPPSRADDYPHQLSGGQRQRVMIAMALIGRPALLIADEPTTALDVTVQAQVLALIARLQGERGMAMLLVSHDLAVIAATCRRVAVMYAGRIVEEGLVDDVLARPIHPYTIGLIASRPESTPPGAPLPTIPGKIPFVLPSGCRFRDRCAFATEICASEPALVERERGQRAWCAHPRA